MGKKTGESEGGGGGRRNGKERKNHGIELSSRVSNSNRLLKSQMPYPSLTVTLNLQCE